MNPEPSGVEFPAETPSGPPRCAFCLHDITATPPVRCPRCEVGYHWECWRTNLQRCAVYGCEKAPFPARAVRPARPVRRFQPAEEESPPLRPWHIAWTLLVAVIIVVSLIRSLPSGRPSGLANPDPHPAAQAANALIDPIRRFANRLEELRELPPAGLEREALLERLTQVQKMAWQARQLLRDAGAEDPRSPQFNALQEAERYSEILRDARRWLVTGVRNP